MLAFAFLAAAGRAAAQDEPWEYAPYRIAVWVVSDHSPLLGQDFEPQLQRSFEAQSRVIAGATWRVSFETPPAALRVPLLKNLDAASAEQLDEAQVQLEGWDKLLVLAFDATQEGIDIAARELDVNTRLWGTTQRRTVRQREMLFPSAFDTAARTFSPLARIDDVSGPQAELKLRAGGLVVDDFCPAAVQVDDVLQAVLRQNDRYGNPRPGGLRALDWTLLHVTEVDQAKLKAQVHSINRAYLAGRVSSRVKRFALAVRPQTDHTTVQVLSKADPPAPLVGYEIYSKDPQSEEVHLVGHTDWRGEIEVVDNKRPLQVLYVRSGGMLLARLPLVPGAAPEASVQLLDDKKRLQAEALVRGVQATLVDLVAQRELLAARIRKRVKEGQLDEAQALVDRLRGLQTQSDLRSRLDRAKQEVASDNPRMQARIDPLFQQAQQQLVNFLRPKLVDELASEVAAARQKP